MNKQDKTILIFSGVLIFIFLIFVIFNSINTTKTINYDEFAQCITENGAVMYGTESCVYCKEQKNLLGDSIKYIKYIECLDNINLCIEAGIEGYPTWLVGTSTKIEGFNKNTTMQSLATATGCVLPKE